ncbi:MAG: S-adenosylmethionine:tRNA ribosyltransferase-isomerase [Bacteroidota bacterium]
MTDPRNISILDYSYHLPEKRIANYPLPERDASRLLIYKEGKISTDIYRNIAAHLPENSLLIFNNTRVIEARLLFQKPAGAVVEIFCLEPDEQYPDITTAMLQKKRVLWKCLVGGASKWKRGQLLEKKITDGGIQITLQAGYIEKKDGSFTIELSWSPSSMSFAELLHHAGAVPLPPYIKRMPEHSDKERYQTVYAEEKGSVAAPTAGLHFTNLIFSHLREKNIRSDYVTLHVGAGTFKPVKSETLQGHEMHAEWMDVSRSTIENILNNLDNTIIAVGTTSLRTIESLYWLGVMSREYLVNSRESLQLTQWEAYELAEKNVPVKEALEALLKWMDANKLDRLVTKTKILIVPGYVFKIVKGLVTNFHQPQSTLLLLVAAFIGDNQPAGQAGWKKVYDFALKHDFRFLSYGDGSLLWRTIC